MLIFSYCYLNKVIDMFFALSIKPFKVLLSSCMNMDLLGQATVTDWALI